MSLFDEASDDRYHLNEEFHDLLIDSKKRLGSRASIHEVGKSVLGESIEAITIAAKDLTPDPTRKQAVICANMHGNEVISSELALYLIDRIASDPDHPFINDLLALGDLSIVPIINPDSRKPAADALAKGKWWARSSRGNHRGVDLNRNLPYPNDAVDAWHPLAGSRFSFFPWYRGKEPLSEPETQALAELAHQLKAKAWINLHSVGELFLYPYCYRQQAPKDKDAFIAMGNQFVAAQTTRTYKIKQSFAWYRILGDTDDWLYDNFNTLAVTVELSKPGEGSLTKPWRLLSALGVMNPPTPKATCEIAADGCLAALTEGLGLEISPR